MKLQQDNQAMWNEAYLPKKKINVWNSRIDSGWNDHLSFNHCIVCKKIL